MNRSIVIRFRVNEEEFKHIEKFVASDSLWNGSVPETIRAILLDINVASMNEATK